MNYYLTIKNDTEAEIVEKKSRFIAYIKKITCEADATEFISSIKSKNYDARHNVFAYTLLDNDIKRYSDDGEPQGTAGIPILDILQKEELKNVCVVVTRYFGGILLGTGGLVRAYSLVCKKAIDQSGIITMRLCKVLSLKCNYNYYGKLPSIINKYEGNVLNTNFEDEIELEFFIPTEYLDAFEKEITEISAGNLSFKELKEEFFEK